MATSDDRWFEVWFTQGQDLLPTWLLVVIPDGTTGRVLIHDPLSNNKLVHRAPSYDAVTAWLAEDEYELVGGRVFPDDGWPLETAPIQVVTSD